MKKIDTPRSFTVWALILLQFLLGLGALAGGGVLITAPDGSILHMPFSALHDSPFTSFLIPGIILFTFVGLFPLAVAYSLWKRPNWRWPNTLNPFKGMHWSWAASLATGVIDIIWITVEVQFMSVAGIHIFYWAWGLVLILLTLLPGVRQYCKLQK